MQTASAASTRTRRTSGDTHAPPWEVPLMSWRSFQDEPVLGNPDDPNGMVHEVTCTWLNGAGQDPDYRAQVCRDPAWQRAGRLAPGRICAATAGQADGEHDPRPALAISSPGLFLPASWRGQAVSGPSEHSYSLGTDGPRCCRLERLGSSARASGTVPIDAPGRHRVLTLLKRLAKDRLERELLERERRDSNPRPPA